MRVIPGGYLVSNRYEHRPSLSLCGRGEGGRMMLPPPPPLTEPERVGEIRPRAPPGSTAGPSLATAQHFPPSNKRGAQCARKSKAVPDALWRPFCRPFPDTHRFPRLGLLGLTLTGSRRPTRPTSRAPEVRHRGGHVRSRDRKCCCEGGGGGGALGVGKTWRRTGWKRGTARRAAPGK